MANPVAAIAATASRAAGPASRDTAEVLCIGDELLRGQIVNGNSRWLAQELASLGIPHHRQGVVGDDPAVLQAAVREASGRCGVLITTGGLGPTPDDLTTGAIADCFSQPLELRDDVLAGITRRYAASGRLMTASNRKQALLPRGATVIPNPVGTAPGMRWEPVPGFTILTFPGVPAELHAMWRQTAAPWLRQQRMSDGVTVSRLLKFWGVSESRLAEAAAPELALRHLTVAPYAGTGEVKLCITAHAATTAAAEQAIAPVQQQLIQRGGASYYGCDQESLAGVVLELLGDRGHTVAVAESCTGGGVGAAFTAVPGSSRAVLGGIVAYHNRIKQQQLAVPGDLLAEHGAVSAAVAEAMAAGVRQKSGANWGLAVTGVAGPGGGSAEKPVGLVHFAVAGEHGTVAAMRQFGAHRGRDWIRALAVGTALDLLRRHLLHLGLDNNLA